MWNQKNNWKRAGARVVGGYFDFHITLLKIIHQRFLHKVRFLNGWITLKLIHENNSSMFCSKLFPENAFLPSKFVCQFLCLIGEPQSINCMPFYNYDQKFESLLHFHHILSVVSVGVGVEHLAGKPKVSGSNPRQIYFLFEDF